MSSRRQRARKSRNEQSWLTGKTLWIAGGVLGLIILAPVLVGFFQGDDEEPEVLQDVVQEFPDEGRSHVAPGTDVEYDTDPPTSGTHYDRWAEPQYYDEEVADGLLVHNLEHGHIVIYYNEARLSDEAAEKLASLTEEYTGQWDAVLAVPREDQDEELVLTAWTYMLELDEYDEELVDAFVDAYRGRGPENPVR